MSTSPTAQRRLLASRLRALREASGLSIEDVAGRLLCSTSKISRLETGARSATARDVRDLALMYALPAAEQETLLTLVQESKQRGWWETYQDVAARSGQILGLEDSAISVQQYETLLLPGPLQTAAYTRALLRFTGPDLTSHAVEQYITTRRERHRKLGADSPTRYSLVLDEAALRRQVGGAPVMVEQLNRLAADAEAGRVSVQVIPFRTGAHPGMDGPFTILEFAEPALPDVVYVERRYGQLLLSRPSETETFHEAMDHLRGVAEDPDRSVELIKMTAREMG